MDPQNYSPSSSRTPSPSMSYGALQASFHACHKKQTGQTENDEALGGATFLSFFFSSEVVLTLSYRLPVSSRHQAPAAPKHLDASSLVKPRVERAGLGAVERSSTTMHMIHSAGKHWCMHVGPTSVRCMYVCLCVFWCLLYDSIEPLSLKRSRALSTSMLSRCLSSCLPIGWELGGWGGGKSTPCLPFWLGFREGLFILGYMECVVLRRRM